MYFVFEFGTVKGMQYCREFYEMKARQEVGEEDLPVFDLVGVAEAEGWDQTELMFFVFKYGVEDGVAFCRECYEMKKSREVRQAVYEPTKETIRFLFRGLGGLGVQEVDGGQTLEGWFASQADLVVGLDMYFTTLGGKVLNSKVGIGSLGLGSFQEVVFHCRLRGGANKGAGRGDFRSVGEWQCSFCMAPHCWQTKTACYRCGASRYWESGVIGQGNLRRVCWQRWCFCRWCFWSGGGFFRARKCCQCDGWHSDCWAYWSRSVVCASWLAHLPERWRV